MRARVLTVILAGAVCVGLASAAWAQYESSERSPVGLRMAIFRPSDSWLKSLGTTWFGPVIDYNAKFDKYDRPGLVLSLGWFGQDGALDKATYLPLTATYIKYSGKERDNSWYYGGGVGAYFVKTQRFVAGTGLVKDSGTELGFNAVVGKEFGAWFADLRYDKVGSLNGVDFSGLTLSVGTHFAF